MPSSGEGPSPLGTWRVGVRPGVCADPPRANSTSSAVASLGGQRKWGGVGHRGMRLYWTVQF